MAREPKNPERLVEDVSAECRFAKKRVNEHDRAVPQNGFDIVVVGGINSDFVLRGESVPKPGETVVMREFFQGPGGKGANQAVAAARLGARVAMIGCVGDDERGEAAIKNLKREGVETRWIARAKTNTGVALILVDKKGEKSIGANMGANQKLTASHVRTARNVIASCKVLLINLEVPDAALFAAVSLKKNRRVILDPAPPRELPVELLQRIEVIRPNSSEAEFLTGVKAKDRKSARRAADILMQRGPMIVVVQAGEKGDLFCLPNGDFFLPQFKVKSIDATGAGDAFAAALAVGWAESSNPNPRRRRSFEDIGRMASATAALKTTKMGAQAGLPKRRALEQFLKNNS
jgi:ribokinase